MVTVLTQSTDITHNVTVGEHHGPWVQSFTFASHWLVVRSIAVKHGFDEPLWDWVFDTGQDRNQDLHIHQKGARFIEV